MFWIGFVVLPVVGAVSLSVFAVTTDPPRLVRDHPLLALAYFVAAGFALVAVCWVVMTWRGGSGDPDS
jgi:hypothetical protein